MIVDPLVRTTARQFGGGSETFPLLIQAVVDAEGGLDKILTAVKCSVDVSTTEEALDVLCRSAVHHLSDFVRTENPLGFLDEFGASWAPLGAANDPMKLNANWVPNVLKLWLEQPS